MHTDIPRTSFMPKVSLLARPSGKKKLDVLPYKHGRIFDALAGMVAADTAAAAVVAVVIPNESTSITSFRTFVAAEEDK